MSTFSFVVFSSLLLTLETCTASSVTFAGVSDSFGEVRVYPRSISPQLAALSCQESFTLQKTCSDT